MRTLKIQSTCCVIQFTWEIQIEGSWSKVDQRKIMRPYLKKKNYEKPKALRCYSNGKFLTLPGTRPSVNSAEQ
jgi:hypothetical protein